MNKEIKTDHFKTLNELLETCKMWIEEQDWYAYNRFFEMQCMEEMYEYIVKLQQENKELQEELQKADSITQSCIFDGKEESQLNYRKAIKMMEELHNKIDKYTKDLIKASSINERIHNKIDKAIEYCNKTKEPYEKYYGKSFDEYDWIVDIARDLLEILTKDSDVDDNR